MHPRYIFRTVYVLFAIASIPLAILVVLPIYMKLLEPVYDILLRLLAAMPFMLICQLPAFIFVFGGEKLEKRIWGPDPNAEKPYDPVEETAIIFD